MISLDKIPKNIDMNISWPLLYVIIIAFQRIVPFLLFSLALDETLINIFKC